MFKIHHPLTRRPLVGTVGTAGKAGQAASAFALCALLAACGGSDDDGSSTDSASAQGALIQGPVLKSALSGIQLTTALKNGGASGRGLLALASGDASGNTTLACGVQTHYYQYSTVDGRGATVTASGAIMLPDGPTSQCSGARPMVAWAHGTNFYRQYNLADFLNTSNPAASEGLVAASIYASQGFIVVAPNYVGYDVSAASAHPYINKRQQGQEMIHAVRAARLALKASSTPLAVSDSGKLFVSGYSQGGYVAMAAQQAMERAGMQVTAMAAGSAPYAIATQVDYVYMGQPGYYGAMTGELLFQGYQAAYGNIYNTPSEMLTDGYLAPMPFASNQEGAQSIVQPTTPMFSATAPSLADIPVSVAVSVPNDKLSALLATTVPAGYASSSPFAPAVSQAAWSQVLDPATGLALANAGVSATSFSMPGAHAVKQSYRAAYLADAYANPDGFFQTGGVGLPSQTAKNGLRMALARNDLRGYVPTAPTLLCGTSEDAVVYFALNTLAMQSSWGTPTATRFTFDLASEPVQSGDPSHGFNALRNGYAASQAAFAAAAGGGARGAAAARAQSHITGSAFCNVAARAFFANF